jgi:hypothetical protein
MGRQCKEQSNIETEGEPGHSKNQTAKSVAHNFSSSPKQKSQMGTREAE